MKEITRTFCLFFVLTTLLIGTSSFSSENLDLSEFKIEFERIEGGLKLIGLKGTAFKVIFVELGDDVQERLDEFGTTVAYVEVNRIDDTLADFEFTIERVNKEYILVSEKGTTWTKLSLTFSKSNKVIVNQYGATLKVFREN